MGWVHRDLKLENIILDGTDIKLIDFGFATDQAEGTNGVMGTAHYVAPEIVLSQLYNGMAADMYAVGVILFVMLYKTYPFPQRGLKGVGPNMHPAEKVVFNAHLSFPTKPKNIPLEAQALIRKLLSDEGDRPTAAMALNDPWLGGRGAAVAEVAAGAVAGGGPRRVAHDASRTTSMRLLPTESEEVVDDVGGDVGAGDGADEGWMAWAGRKADLW